MDLLWGLFGELDGGKGVLLIGRVQSWCVRLDFVLKVLYALKRSEV